MSTVVVSHAAEVQRGDRFEFGRNWQRFLRGLSEERIAIAERSLSDYLGQERFDGLRFLDVGSGSGLFSLAARRLGADVASFDYDPHSVACTEELRRRYFPGDPRWTIAQGSVLDREFLAAIGPADIVYSWGVLHHTGAMAAAFANVERLVPVGGRLFIAVYNDLGDVTDKWWRVKRRYNNLPRPVRLPYALAIIGPSELRRLLGHLRRRELRGYLRTWSDYQRQSVRGMSRWHDWIDWIGGFPYERASVETVVDTFAARGFRLKKLVDRSSGYGCNEFVFGREAADAVTIDQPIDASPLLSRRFGRALLDLRSEADGSLSGCIGARPPQTGGGRWMALERERLLGEVATPNLAGAVRIPPGIAAGRCGAGPVRLAALCTEPVAGQIVHQRGLMWRISAPHLSRLADDATPRHRSPIFVFEDDRQLAFPHSLHAEIARHGGGRFSHWGDCIYFSTSDGSNPVRNGRLYRLVYPPAAPQPAGTT
jgi:2-polyprenyl-6-hydroxyphenyl methylase/3-demethylubiquinone-9 3-methyltransferase